MIIELPNGPNFADVLSKLVDLLTKKQASTDIDVSGDFKFANHITETGWMRLFRPMTVGRFIRHHGNPANSIVDKVYEVYDIKPSTQIRRMPGNHRKILSMLTTLSWTNNLIFDLVGVDPTGGEKAYSLAKEKIKHGGTVILLDNYDDFKNDCTTYIKYELVSGKN